MRPILPFLLLILLYLSCDNAQEQQYPAKENFQLLGTSYQDYRKIPYLKNYLKVSDTSFIDREFKYVFEPTHRITQLKENKHTLILFSKITYDDKRNEILSILDTLKINNLDKKSRITIGYCVVEKTLMEQTIAIIPKTKNDTIYTILSAWKADPKSEKINKINPREVLMCFQEF